MYWMKRRRVKGGIKGKNMLYYLYDGSFEGLLTVIHEAYYRQDNPDKIIKKMEYREDLFAEKIEITTDQDWVIHDCKRDRAILYNQEEWIISGVDEMPEIEYSEEEGYYQELWQEFFDSVALTNRRNLRLQRQYMPTRYWKHLIEK